MLLNVVTIVMKCVYSTRTEIKMRSMFSHLNNIIITECGYWSNELENGLSFVRNVHLAQEVFGSMRKTHGLSM